MGRGRVRLRTSLLRRLALRSARVTCRAAKPERCAPSEARRFLYSGSLYMTKPSQQSLPSVALMLAKPLSIAVGDRVTKTLYHVHHMSGGTASTKRTQGRYQAAGRFAPSRRLIQLRKQRDVEADPVTLRGRQHREARSGERSAGPPESTNKTVARYQRSVGMPYLNNKAPR